MQLNQLNFFIGKKEDQCPQNKTKYFGEETIWEI